MKLLTFELTPDNIRWHSRDYPLSQLRHTHGLGEVCGWTIFVEDGIAHGSKDIISIFSRWQAG